MKPESEKFLLFTLEYPPFKGGIAQYYKNLAGFWPTDDFFVLADNALGGQDTNKLFYRRLLSSHIRPRWLRAIFQLRARLLELGKNTHVIIGQILPLGQAAYYLQKFFQFKYSIILHGLDFTLATKTKSKRIISKKILRKAEKIICANSHTANLVKFFDINLAAKVFVVNPGIEPSFIRNPQRVSELKQRYHLEGKTVLFGLGRLVLRKGIDNVIKAMKLISETAPQTVYAIAGAGPEEKFLKNLVDSLPKNLKNNIIFLGQISDTDRWAWLELCDIFIMASRNIAGDFEGFGTVYLEANLAGKPVIAGDSGGVHDAVINNINGLLVDPEDLKSIAGAVLSLSADANLRQALGEQGKRRAVENFNAKKQTEKIYSYLISE